MQRAVSQIVLFRPAVSGRFAFRILLAAALAAAFAQITLGGFVRAADAGLACADDWPLCDGQWIPAFTGDVILEYSHRLTAVLLGIFVLAAAVVGRWASGARAVSQNSAWASLVLVIAAGGLGWATVVTELSWGMRLVHLALAEALIAALAVALIASWSPVASPAPHAPSPKAAGVVMGLVLTLIFMVLVSGSVVVGQEASTACGSWPLCSGSMILPEGDAKFAYHMSHRFTSAAAGLVILAAAAWTWRGRRWWPGAGAAAVALVALLIGQVFVGAANPWSAFSPEWKGVHVAFATATWLCAVVMAALVLLPVRPAAAGGIRGPQGEGQW